MRQARLAIMILLMISGLVLAGCSSKTDDMPDRSPGRQGEFPGGRHFGFNSSMNMSDEDRHFGSNSSMNMSDEDRQAMMQQMQQEMVDACNEKSEGDSCQLSSMHGDMEGTCGYQGDNLTCMVDRPERQR